MALEYYPVLTFEVDGSLDLELQQQQLHAEVDRLETADYAPATIEPHESEWRPDAHTRRRLITATKPTYRTRMTTGALPSRAEEPRRHTLYGHIARSLPEVSRLGT